MQSPFDPKTQSKNLVIGIGVIIGIAYFQSIGAFDWLATWLEPTPPENPDGKTKAAFETASFFVDMVIKAVVLLGYVASFVMSGGLTLAQALASRVWAYAHGEPTQNVVVTNEALPAVGTPLPGWVEVAQAAIDRHDEELKLLKTKIETTFVPATAEAVKSAIDQIENWHNLAKSELDAVKARLASTPETPQ